MSKLLFLLCALTFGLGIMVMMVAKSAFHEQIAVGVFLCSALFFCAAAVVSSLNRLIELLKDQADLRLIESIHERNPRER